MLQFVFGVRTTEC